MLDFAKIHAFDQGQRSSFEELVCQLARLEQVALGSTFRRVEGSGGDGGVEAYWTTPLGRVIGYQAKYFLRSNEIDWDQIDESVSQTILSHPNLQVYVVALPCDLTGRSGSKQRGRPGWDHWDDRVSKWKQQAASAGLPDVEFQPWTSSELLARLAAPAARGVQEYFFGSTCLSSEWLKDKLTEAVQALDERFHPEDHVNVRVEKLSLAIARAKPYRQELTTALQRVEVAMRACRLPTAQSMRPDKVLIDTAEVAYEALQSVGTQIALDPQHPWHAQTWLQRVQSLLLANRGLTQWYLNYENNLPNASSEKYSVRQHLEKHRELNDALEHLHAAFSSHYNVAEDAHVAFVRGSAGAGKSHLLARCAQVALDQGRPAVLLLGNRFNDGEFWRQVGETLGLHGRDPDQILGALDAAGKLAGTRTLLLIDAINEGVGSKYWFNHIASVVHKAAQFSHVSLIFSCRAEYFQSAVPNELASKIPVFSIRGFETYDEQLEAARVYLDRRGIARPSTPWLAPEFVNPLFLRSVCVALERDKKTELPVGLNGTKKILSYYLDSVASNIAQREASALPLSASIRRSVLVLVGAMLERRTDYLEVQVCLEILASTFRNVAPRTESDWLSVLLRSGLLRTDPHPSADEFLEEDVVRLSFQRFQDFLMAERAIEGESDAATLFADGGKLAFCLDGGSLAWEWRGLMSALAVAIPEKHSVELVDVLPNGPDVWWQDWSIQEGFTESVKWRARTAFSDRTLQLLNQSESPFEILLQLAVSEDHPWNAELLHTNLVRKRIAVRDTHWTVWVNHQSDEPDSAVGVLIEWCRRGQTAKANHQNQYLAGLTLCWLFTSTNRRIRDTATKSLASLFLSNESLFPKLLPKFAQIDDLYVTERILGAAFAACCHDPTSARLAAYSTTTYREIFEAGVPPVGLLLRDYALGIVELANAKDCIANEIDIAICTPPYRSKPPQLTVTEDRLAEVAARAGGSGIVNSAVSFMGDFSRYEIEPRVRRFIEIPQSESVPLTSRQQARAFEAEVVEIDQHRVAAYERLTSTTNPYSYGILAFTTPRSQKKPGRRRVDRWKKDIQEAEDALLSMLSEEEIRRFHAHVAPYLHRKGRSDEDKYRFDVASIKRWVARRAYAYGWTARRFPPHRDHSSSYSRERPKVERIGKKYQWLALDEFLCRTADNFWMTGEYDSPPSIYRSPLDIGFERDIDVTVLRDGPDHRNLTGDSSAWALQPALSLEQTEESELAAWPFTKDLANLLDELPSRVDVDGVSWLVVYEHVAETEKYAEDELGSTRAMEHGMRMQEFRFLATIIVESADLDAISAKLKNGIDLQHWAVPEQTDAAFLRETPWRHTWDKRRWLLDDWKLPAGTRYSTLVARYHWESHLDASLPNGYSTHVPAPWVAEVLGLKADSQEGIWRDQAGEVVFQELVGDEGAVVCLLRSESVAQLLDDRSTCLTMLIAERSVWPGGFNELAAWRRTEGIAWREAAGTRSASWTKDARNSASEGMTDEAQS